MSKIIIATSTLGRSNWAVIYQFIKSIVEKKTKLEILESIKKIANLRLASTHLDKDVYSLYGEEVSLEKISTLSSKDTCFSIIYKKNDDREDFVELVPFVLLQEKFRGIISLGIDIDKLDKQNSYIFKCSDFFILIDKIKPKFGQKSIYFINEKNIDKETGEVKNISKNGITSLRGKSEAKETVGKRTVSSRRFLPLFRITEKNYTIIFGNGNEDESVDCQERDFINKSIEQIKAELFPTRGTGKKNSELKSILESPNSIFGHWLENGYFYSLDEDDAIPENKEGIQGIKNILQIYKNSIFELVQNIIFHGGKKGLLYCVFDRWENLSDITKKKLLHPDVYRVTHNDLRFLRIGVFDFSPKGIIDTFDSEEELSLMDFFNPETITTTGLTRLDMRYAARLGIKTFVKTVSKYKGYFSVESSQTINNRIIKSGLHTTFEKEKVQFQKGNDPIEYLDGTHYEILLPVIATENQPEERYHFQKKSLPSENLKKYFWNNASHNIIEAIVLPKEICDINNSTTKDIQIKNIQITGNQIIEEINKKANSHKSEIAINLENKEIDPKLIFKLLAYLQLKEPNNGFEKIILTNAADHFIDEFCGLVKTLLIDTDAKQLWSNQSGIILINEDLRVQIISGETKEELYAINEELSKYYHSNKNFFDKPNASRSIPQEFILPYDILVNSSSHTSLFEIYLENLLKRRIISDNNRQGCLVNHKNTYIGNKIIVKNYYEADTLFLNSFFTERFAYLIVSNLKKLIKKKELMPIKGKDLVLIGYKHYSEYLLKTIKKTIEQFLKKESGENKIHIHLVIANEEKDTLGGDEISFNFDRKNGDREEMLQKRIISNPDDYCFATIVPIGSTLSTNDKVIAFFKLWFRKQQEYRSKTESYQKESREELDLKNECFIYNHCVIVVRDKIQNSPTTLEKYYKWEAIKAKERVVTTSYNNAPQIHFSIQIASENDDKTENNWEKRLNQNISFPKNWQEEKYVNYTENSSINSQNLMGFPKVGISNEEHREELERLFELKNDIYKGHINIFNSHHKYYIDTETFVKRKDTKLAIWLNSLKEKAISIFKNDLLNILITPNAESESDFIHVVNETIFNHNALIVYLDINNWQNNITHKLSFLKELNNVRYHYVDQALLTGESYSKTKNYLFSIVDRINFSSIFSIVNRLPFDKLQEIKQEIRDNLFVFVNLHYPASKELGQECELCKLKEYYKKLKERTVLENCHEVIENNIKKIESKDFKRLIESDGKENRSFQCEDQKKREIKRERVQRRNFIRLVLTHELYYIISEIAHKKNNTFNTSCAKIKDQLDMIYDKLCGNNSATNTSISEINEKIDSWFKNDLSQIGNEELRNRIGEYLNKKLQIDKKISFLKVISSPPLSQYIIMRQYAHEKLLVELHNILRNKDNKNNEYSYDDLRLLKSILKSLSFLRSNALVRKKVIIGVWDILGKIVCKLEAERTNLEDVKKAIENQKKSPDLFDLPILHRLQKEISFDIELLPKEESEIIKDFGKDMQFFIKNTIVEDETKAMFLGELLRTGKEIEKLDDEIQISETCLSIGKEQGEEQGKNALFDYKYNFIKDISKEYIKFLVWLFYDNTTIIRKTLDNFIKELDKEKQIYNCFYNEDNTLRSFSQFKEAIRKEFFDTERGKKSFVDYLKSKIEKEYYYLSFKPYLSNGDKIDYLRKLIYVTYAKLKLKDLIEDKHKEDIEIDTRDLMEIFAFIMGADAAFFSMRNGKQLYPVSLYGKVGDTSDKWAYDKWFLYDNYRTGIALGSNMIKAPLIPRLPLQDENNNKYGEKRDLGAEGLGIYLIANTNTTKQDESSARDDKKSIEHNMVSNIPKNKVQKYAVAATITFLYGEQNSIVSSQKKFRINFQESGRLLLLLKNEINKYVIDYLVNDKVLDLWVERLNTQKLNEDFISRYRNNTHGAKKFLDQTTSIFFEKDSPNYPDLIAILADLYVGDIHYSLLAKRNRDFGANFKKIEKVIAISLVISARKHLIQNYFAKENIHINLADFKGRKICYTIETPFILFQLVNNIIIHSKQDKRFVQVYIYPENEYIVFKNTYSKITPEQLNNINKIIFESNVIPRKSISLYCINYYVRNMCDNSDRKKKTELVIEMAEKDSFIVKIPIIKE